jgi:hypothetical protein
MAMRYNDTDAEKRRPQNRKKGWNNHTESPDNGVVKIARDKSSKKKINRPRKGGVTTSKLKG